MKQAIFSPCQPCENEPESALIWQIKADQITHDEKNNDIDYQNATLEVFDIPIFFTPYFTHPDPTVKRRSGLLPPTLSYSESKGFIYGQPYFLTLGRAKDLELEPTIYTKEGVTLETHYRKAFSNGFINLETSLGILDNAASTENSTNTGVEGSVSLKTDFSLNETWRAKFDLEQTSDKSFTRRYLSEDKEMLTSRLLIEGFRSRNYFSVEGYKFQGLRSFDIKGQQPKVLPSIFYNFVGEPDELGGRTELETTLRSISRQLGSDSHIFSLSTGWKLPYYSPDGSLIEITALAQSDLFIVDYHRGRST
jgi:LPS-assembly protein